MLDPNAEKIEFDIPPELGCTELTICSLEEQIRSLLKQMEYYGLILTVEQVPNKPLAMGNSHYRVGLRGDKQSYRKPA